MLQICFSTIQTGFYVTILEHGSFARNAGFSTVAGEVPTGLPAQHFIKFVISVFIFVKPVNIDIIQMSKETLLVVVNHTFTFRIIPVL